MTLHMFANLYYENGNPFYQNYVAAKTAKDAAIYLEVDEEEVRQLDDDSEFHAWFDEEPTDLPPGERVEPHEDGGQWQWVTTAAKAAKYYGEGRVLSEDEEWL